MAKNSIVKWYIIQLYKPYLESVYLQSESIQNKNAIFTDIVWISSWNMIAWSLPNLTCGDNEQRSKTKDQRENTKQ